ncbi:MAG: substrate-binding domain-containing protein [Chloroflexi bacterium]|nr:substrate-binding domain-containing protein [Chloroflexota bacterium]
MSFLPRRVGGGMLALLALLIAPVLLLAQEDVTIRVVGSGVVTPLLEQAGATLDVTVTGTNDGFARFCQGAADIAATTRPISAQEEANCVANGVTYLELVVAHNVAAVVTSSENTFAQCLTIDELGALFAPSSQNTNWNQINASFPDTALTLNVPASNTATFALLDGLVEGEGVRSDANVIPLDDIGAVSTNPGAVGVVPLPIALAGGVKIIELNAGDAGCAAPSAETVEGRTYTAAQRLFVYANVASLSKAGLTDLLNTLVGDNAGANAEAAGFTAASTEAYENDRAIIAEGRSGREFSADVTAYTIPVDVSGAVTIGGAAAGANYLTSVTSAFATEFPGVTATTTIEGEQAGIRRLCNGEVDLIAATGELTQEQADNCAANNISVTPVDLGEQAVVLVANGSSSYLQCLTTAELGAVWNATSTGSILTWDQVRADFPATSMTLFSPESVTALTDLLLNKTAGVGTINRVDIQLNDDPLYRAAATANVEGALTFMDWAEYQTVLANNQANIQLVGVGEGCVQPSEATIADGSYPISQPLRLLVNNTALARREVQAVLYYAASDAQYGLITAQGLVGLGFDELAGLRQSLQEAFTAAEFAVANPTPEATAEATAEATTEATPEATPAS